MPLPVFHSVASYSVYRMMGKTGGIRPDRKFLWLGLFLGLLPDFDFLPGVLLGNPTLFHRDFSHSPFMGVFVSLVVGLTYGVYRRLFAAYGEVSGPELRANVLKVMLFSFLTYSAHLALDYFSAGIPLFWPLTVQRFSHPMGFFQVAREHSSMLNIGGMREFVGRLLSSTYAVSFFFEVFMVLYAAAFIMTVREMSGGQAHGRSAALIRVVQVMILTTLGLFVI